VKRKIGTALEEQLLREAKLLAAREDRTLAAVFEDALRQYLARRQATGKVQATRGALPASASTVRQVLEEDDFIAG